MAIKSQAMISRSWSIGFAWLKQNSTFNVEVSLNKSNIKGNAKHFLQYAVHEIQYVVIHTQGIIFPDSGGAIGPDRMQE